MKLLVFGHVSDTGFGVVTEELCRRFIAHGIDVRILAVNHRGEPVKGPLAGRVWPADISGMPYGGDISGMAIDGTLWATLDRNDDWKPDRVLAIADMSGFLDHMGKAPGDYNVTAQWLTLPVHHYCPIEGDNLSPAWAAVWQHVKPIAMSEYGANVIGTYLGRPVPMIYHGVDTETFRAASPLDPIEWNGKVIRSKVQAKQAFGLDPSRNVILRTDRYVPRKFYDVFLRSMAEVLAERPDTDVLMHCNPTDSRMNMFEEIGRLPSKVYGQIKFTGMTDTYRGLTKDGLVTLLNAADIYVSTTGGEGFGLTLAESLACEVPVVVTSWAAETEVAGPGAILVPPLTDSYGDPVRYHSTYGMDWAMPDARGFVEPVLSLLQKPSRRRSLGAEGRAHVVRSFSWDRAADQMIHLFEDADALAA